MAPFQRKTLSPPNSTSKNFWKMLISCEPYFMIFMIYVPIRFPIPPQLRQSDPSLVDSGTTAIEIAPLVFLHIELWPSLLLRRLDGAPTKSRLIAVTDAPKSEQGEVSGRFFGLTLCIGKYIYTSVSGVHETLVDFILNNWLRWVPLRGRSSVDGSTFPSFINTT